MFLYWSTIFPNWRLDIHNQRILTKRNIRYVKIQVKINEEKYIN